MKTTSAPIEEPAKEFFRANSRNTIGSYFNPSHPISLCPSESAAAVFASRQGMADSEGSGGVRGGEGRNYEQIGFFSSCDQGMRALGGNYALGHSIAQKLAPKDLNDDN